MADEAISQESGMSFETDESRAQWLETLPEPVRQWQEATTATSPEAFFEQMGNLRSQVGRSLVIPGEDASDEARSEFYRKAVERSGGKLTLVPDAEDEVAMAEYLRAQGVPEEAKAYEFPDIEGAPPDLISEDRANALREMALRHGLPASKFKAMAEDMLKLDISEMQAAQEAQTAAQAELRADWGDAYEQRYTRLHTFLERDKAPQPLIQAAANKQLGPDTAKYLYGMLDRLGSESADVARQTGGADVDSVEDAKAKLAEIDANPNHPYRDPTHPDHKDAIARYVRLVAKAYPEASRQPPQRAALPPGLDDDRFGL